MRKPWVKQSEHINERSRLHVFFLVPWSAEDPLAQATAFPHVTELISRNSIAHVEYFTTETRLTRNPEVATSSEFAVESGGDAVGLSYLMKSTGANPLLGYAFDRLYQLKTLCTAAKKIRPNLVICRGTTGIFGDLLRRRMGIPYVVESFEPHAHYMRQTGTWSHLDPKYLVQRRWEERVKRSAAALITVSYGYARHLQNLEGISPSRLHTVPCWVDGERYRIDPEARSSLRLQLGIGDRLAVVYAGKFGGIYAPLGDLAMLRTLQQALGRHLFVILLTPHDAKAVKHQLAQAGFSPGQSFVARVAYEQVGAYLNAADLALSFWSSGPWSFACSPIKHGESWACGLPLLMPPGVGDEAQWLEAERAGAIASFTDPSSLAAAAQRLQPILAEPGHRQRIRAIGLRERGPGPLKQVYGQLLDQFSVTSPAHG